MQKSSRVFFTLIGNLQKSAGCLLQSEKNSEAGGISALNNNKEVSARRSNFKKRPFLFFLFFFHLFVVNIECKSTYVCM